MTKKQDPDLTTSPPYNPSPDLLADRALLDCRERQLTALRKAMTTMCWAGVCDELPAARDWFDDEGCLR